MSAFIADECLIKIYVDFLKQIPYTHLELWPSTDPPLGAHSFPLKGKVMESALKNFKFAQFQFSLRAVDCINLPVYKGSTKESITDETLLPYFVITSVGKHGSKRYGVREEKGKIRIV